MDRGERDMIERMFAQAPSFVAIVEGRDHRFTVANRAFRELAGTEGLIGKAWAEVIPERAGQGLVERMDEAARSGGPFVGRGMTLCFADPAGPAEEVVDLLVQPLRDAGNGTPGILVEGHRMPEDRRNEELRSAHNRVLELAIGDSPLAQTLAALIAIVESSSQTGVQGSILLLDREGMHLRHGAAPSLPEAYMAAIDGAAIGPCAGSCGTAAFTASPVFVADIAESPLWAGFRDLALPHGLRACWSVPILTRGRKVLGTFAMYHREPREPTVRDLVLVELVTQTAALVIDRERAQAALRDIATVAGAAST